MLASHFWAGAAPLVGTGPTAAAVLMLAVVGLAVIVTTVAGICRLTATGPSRTHRQQRAHGGALRDRTEPLA